MSNYVTQLDTIYCVACVYLMILQCCGSGSIRYVLGLPDSDLSINNNKKVGQTLISTIL
jgi:hypothetical protein